MRNAQPSGHKTHAAGVRGVMAFVLGSFLGAACVISVSTASDGYNDGHRVGDPNGTHYAHCYDDHHTRRQYANYSEATLHIITRYGPELTLEYKQLFLDASSWWNVQGTKVNVHQSTTGTNYWRTYSNPNDGLNGYVTSACTHYSGLHETINATIWMNLANIGNDPPADKLSSTIHEMGHQIGLSHSLQTNAQANPAAVMWPVRDPDRPGTPQVDDVCGVNAVYRSNTYPVSGSCHGDHWLLP